MMKRKFSIMMMLMIISISSFANGNDEPTKRKKSKTIFGAYLMFDIDIPFIETDLFDQMLMDNNLIETNFLPTTAGLSLHQQFNRVHLTFGYSNSSRDLFQKTFNTTSSIRYRYVQMGYDLINKSRYSLVPFVGWKRSRIDFEISENVDITDLEQFTNTDLNYKNFRQNQNFLDLGISVSRQKFFRLNLRSGFLIPVFQEQWRLNNQTAIPLSTSFFKQQFYVSFGIGAGFITSRSGSLKKIGEIIEEMEKNTDEYEVERDIYPEDDENDLELEEETDEVVPFEEI